MQDSWIFNEAAQAVTISAQARAEERSCGIKFSGNYKYTGIRLGFLC